MKRLFYLLVVLLSLVSCRTTFELSPPRYYSSHIDYSYLTDRGIFITESNSVSFEYKTLGSLFIECTGGWVKNDKKNKVDMEDIYMRTEGKYIYVKPSLEDAFNLAVEELDKMKGNGIVNFNISTGGNSNTIIITGMVIKR